jgi:AraC family ethanolamine operon transcriptional activator
MTHGDGSPQAPARRSGPRVVAQQWTDFDQLAQAFVHWDIRFQQFGPGPFRGALSIVQVDGVQLLRVTMNRTILASGVPPRGVIPLSPVTPANRSAIFRGERLRPGQLNFVAPGDEINHLTSAAYDNIIVAVDANLLAKTADCLHGLDVAYGFNGSVAVQPDPRACLATNNYLARLLREFTRKPALVANPVAGQRLAKRCVERMAGLLAGTTAQESRPRTANPQRLVHGAEQIMAASLREPLTTIDLCRELSVSERTLRYAFREVRGTSPMAYYKAWRLNTVRRELKAAGNEGTVADVAGRWGFWHTGEFAADYRRLFGELPSQTVARENGLTARVGR